jgi:MFS family permease
VEHKSESFSEGAPDSAALPISPSAAVFLTSMAFMLVEMNAGRLTSWHIGSSLHSWTSVIGVMFGGMSLGNYIGGRLAEGGDLRRTLGRLYLGSAIAVLSILWTHNFVYGVEDGWVAKARASGMDWIPVPFERFIDWFADSFPRLTRVVILCSLSFFPSAVLMGMISPVIAKIALDTSPRHGGRAIGSVYAWGAVGSIAGTFLAGFFLISFLGMRGLLSVTAVLLSVLGIVLGRQTGLNSTALTLGVLTLVFGTAPWLWAYNVGAALKIRETRDDLLFVHESDYQYLRCYRSMHELEIVSPDGNVEIRQVVDREYRRLTANPPPGRMRKVRELRSLTLDHLIHGYVWLRMPPNAAGDFDAREAVFDARDLHYAYEQVYAVLTYRTSRHVKDRPLTTLSLGAGSYTFPRYLFERYPGSLHDVAEIDPAVTLAGRRALKLDVESMTVNGAPAVRIYHADARNFVEAALAKGWTYDVIYGDAFNHYSIPFHLTTKEFHDEIRALLKPGGAYLANVIDTYESSRFLAWYARTLQETFNHVHIACQRAATAVATDDGLERVCEQVEFEGVTVELLDSSGAVIAARDAGDVFRVRKKRDGLWMLTHDGEEIRGASVRWRGGKAHLFPPVGRDGVRRSITVDGSSIKSIEERNRRSRDTFVIVASVDPVDLEKLGAREGDPRFLRAIDRRLTDVDRITVFTPQELALMFRRTGASIFRDDFAPVDNLLVPVFTDRD